jgi:hypothetical protein
MHKRSLRRGLTALALAISVPAALAAGAATASAAPAAPPVSCTPTIVKSAELVRTVDGPAIQVSGIKPHADGALRLEAQDIAFVIQPDYFPYDVNECGGTGPVVKTPYTELFRVPTAPVGRFGIQIGDFLIDLFPHTA